MRVRLGAVLAIGLDVLTGSAHIGREANPLVLRDPALAVLERLALLALFVTVAVLVPRYRRVWAAGYLVLLVVGLVGVASNA